jgi:hypothetical protein
LSFNCVIARSISRTEPRIEGRARGEPLGMPAAGVGRDVVGLTCQRRAFARPHHLHAGRGEEQQLPVDPVFVHVRETQRAEILQHPLQVRVPREHAAHLQCVVVGRVAALEILDLRLDEGGEGPGLLGRDPLERCVAVDHPRRRREADSPARYALDVVAGESLLAAVG